MILNFSLGPPIPTKDEMLHFLDMVPYFPHVAVDTEGDFKLEPNLFLGFSLAFLKTGMYFPVAHMEAEANIDSEVLEKAMKVVDANPLRVMHHAGHDLKEIEKIGYSMWDKPYACTMIMCHMINENLPNKSLDNMHKHYTGGEGKDRPEVMQSIINTMGWRYIPAQLMSIYATQDAVACSELFVSIKDNYIEQFGELYEAG